MNQGPASPEPRGRPRGGEPKYARSAYRMRLRFAVFGVVVGIVFAVWAVIWAAGDGDVNPVVPIIAIVFLTAAIVNVLGVVRARDRAGDRAGDSVSDGPTRSAPSDDDDGPATP